MSVLSRVVGQYPEMKDKPVKMIDWHKLAVNKKQENHSLSEQVKYMRSRK